MPEAAPLTISVDRSDPAAPVLGVAGDLAYDTAAPLREEIDDLLGGRPTTLVFDFTGLLFLDSTGLSVLVHAWQVGQEVGAGVELRAVPRFLTTILDLTGVAGLLERQVDERPRFGSSASA
ncbi:STAS domain-containing protein [Micromonospora sp. DT31]|uniref:STAS domain-containing protein n=1 Tax=Micromonospora sp. DT31 TaxID=3393434 RepID=UPI003CEBD3F4